MRDRTPQRTSAGFSTRPSARGVAGTVLLNAAFLYLTRNMVIPLGVLYAVILIAAWMLYRAHLARADALRDAGIQQRRASVLADPRLSPTVEDLLHSGPRDQLVGHTDRERVIEQLGERYATGHLTADDFEARTTEASQARTRGDLARTLRDLP